MENPLHAQYYADTAAQCDVEIIEQRQLATETYLIRLACPDLAAAITPGQFVMVRKSQHGDPLLGRAFALYDVISDANGHPHAIDIVFHVVGKLTTFLAQTKPGQRLVVWGPLGNGFGDFQSTTTGETPRQLVMVAGGIGQTPFLALAKECLGKQEYGNRVGSRCNDVALCYGARSAEFFAGLDEFKDAGVDVHLATDDGSAGHHGLVTQLLQQQVASWLDGGLSKAELLLVCCGPEPMMEAVAGYAAREGLRCQVSLETPMACGLGICFSCVTRVLQPDGSWDFKRTCVDGPIFEADQLVW